MDDQAPPRKSDEEGGDWITTFADLMSLLMCFFVLLLSFAEMDLNKFKAIAGSMSLAFGVQREVRAPETPVGTSIIAQEFSPGRPEPTAINDVRQTTMDSNKQTIEFTDSLTEEVDPLDPQDGDGYDGKRAERSEQTEADTRTLMESLSEEIDKGMIQIETAGQTIVIRIREKASFPSGAAHFHSGFLPVITKLRTSLQEIGGTIVVAGHTDNIPIKTTRFRSNWDLSAARAVSVVHELLDGVALDPARFVVEGHGDAHPLVPNDTAENRSLNRRVEMTIQQKEKGDAAKDEPIAALTLPAADGELDAASTVPQTGEIQSAAESESGGQPENP